MLSPNLTAQTIASDPRAGVPSHNRTASLHGRVVDPAGLPVVHAQISARSILSGASFNTESATDGTFELTNLLAGAYFLTASTDSLSLAPLRIEIAAGQDLNAGDLHLSISAAQQQIVVSASRVEETQDEAPTKVLSISSQEIQHTGYERVGDVLSEVPGVVTRAQSFGVGITGGEQIDGIDSKETAILIDGLPVAGARGITEGFIDLNQQDVGRLDHVEVVKGAASALYGTDALGGVINLVTREPSAPLNIDATMSGGSLSQFDTRLGIGGQWRNLSGYLDLERHQEDAYSLLPNDPSTVGPDENRQGVLLKLRYTFNPRASLGFTSSAYENHDHGLGLTFLTDPNDPSNFINSPTALRSNDSTQTYALVGDFLPTSTTTLQARAYTSIYNEDSASRLIGSAGEGTPFDLGNLTEVYRRADATLGQQWGQRQFIQAGYELARDEYRGDNRIVGGDAGQHLATNDVWAQDRVPLFHNNLLLTLGVRYQNNSAYGNHAVPKIGAVYRLNDHFTLRAAFGEGFRAPNLGDLYYHLLHLEFGYQVIGNPTLLPETSQSYSFGSSFTSRRYQFSLNFFRNNLRNLINDVLVCDETAGQDCAGGALETLLAKYGVPSSFDYDATGAALFTFINLNIDRAYTEGFDIDGRVALSRSLALSGAYTYLEAADPVAHTWLPYRNRHQGHIKLEYARPRWGLLANVRGTFFSRWPNGETGGTILQDYAYGYQIWNTYISKSLLAGFQIFGAVDNFNDSRDKKLSLAKPSFDRPDYGRTFRIGLHYEFPRRQE
jgi:outer membrane receptor for ferrienterochelin and colicins